MQILQSMIKIFKDFFENIVHLQVQTDIFYNRKTEILVGKIYQKLLQKSLTIKVEKYLRSFWRLSDIIKTIQDTIKNMLVLA